jgi:ribonucleoside-diphosphate reductase beta chain
MLLDPGLELTLRPMKYPRFFEMYRDAIRNTWTVEEVDLSVDLNDLRSRMSEAERHLIHRLVAFFATGDSIVSNNLALNLYRHINAPEARMYLSRQLFEEALHVQFYLTLLDTYVPDPDERAKAFSAVENIPSIRDKAHFCLKHTDALSTLHALTNREERRRFVENLLAYACGIEGLFFFAAFAYVYFLRSRGLCQGLAAGTNRVFRDEAMIDDAVRCELGFAKDLLSGGVAGLSLADMREYLQFVADRRLAALGIAPRYRSKNPFDFMDLQDVQELANFFERRVSAYQVGVTGSVSFDEAF